MTGRTIEELAVGDCAQMTRTITVETVREFVDATGDDNPLHSDPVFAATTRFGQVIAPGILTGGLLSAVIGTQLPGPGAIYLSQSFRFLKPVFLGDAITARVDVAEVVRERNRMRLLTVCVNQAGEAVLEGEAWIMPSRVRIEYQARAPSRRAWGAGPYAPAALAAQVMSFWMASGFAFAEQASRFYRPRAARTS